ncbi:MAG: hypothetical protein LUE99_00445 [Bacteroides sp.]|nr:hypothetical protein [Bacteroides sp.]
MVTWLSVKSTAEKYGITEEAVCKLMKLRYITYSSIDYDDEYYDEGLVDTDDLESFLRLNSIPSYPDDESVQRVSNNHLNWLYGENERLEEVNDELLEKIRLLTQKEAALKKI